MTRSPVAVAFVAFFLLALVEAASASNIAVSACGQAINQVGGYYLLSHSITGTGSGSCLNVAAQNITIDCNGSTISTTYPPTQDVDGIYSNQFNTTVSNCSIANFEESIYFAGAHNGTIAYVNASNASNVAVFLSSTNYASVMNSTISVNSSTGHSIEITGTNNLVRYNNITAKVQAVDIQSSGNTIEDNNITTTGSTPIFITNSGSNNIILHNSIMADVIWVNVVSGTGNAFNDSTSGNAYYFLNGTSSWQIFDIHAPTVPGYATSGRNIPFNSSLPYTLWLGSGAADWHPWVGLPLYSGCVNLSDSTTYQNKVQGNMAAGFTVSSPVALCLGAYGFAGVTALSVNAPNVTINCNGSSITGNNVAGTYGIYSNQFNTTVDNCNISNFQTGVYFVGATNGSVQNTSVIASIISAPARGIYLYSGWYNNHVINCSASVAGAYGIGLFVESSSGDRITDSTGVSPSYEGIQLSSASNTTVSDCFISGKDAAGALIVYSNSDNNLIANSTVNGNAGAYAATLQGGSNTGNTFINNTMLNATSLVWLDANAGSNNFYWNNFTSASGLYVNDTNGSNAWNGSAFGISEGNIWGDVINGSVGITGTSLSSGFPALDVGSGGTGWPYNGTNSAKVAGVTDYAPLFNQAPPNVFGNGSSINTTNSPGLSNVTATIGNSAAANGTQQAGTQPVSIANNGSPLFVFNYSFTGSQLNFSNVTIGAGVDAAIGAAYASISGVDPSGIVGGKTLYMYDANPAITSVCVLDEEGVTYLDIVQPCDSANGEYLVPCNGTLGQYACTWINNTTLAISGLNHSAAMQFASPTQSPQPSSKKWGVNYGGGGSPTHGNATPVPTAVPTKAPARQPTQTPTSTPAPTVTPTVNPDSAAAQNLISTAQDAVSSAQKKGADTAQANADLFEARQAFARDDYSQAMALALAAIKDAETPSGVQASAAPAIGQASSASMPLLAFLGATFILLLGIYLFMKRRHGKRND